MQVKMRGFICLLLVTLVVSLSACSESDPSLSGPYPVVKVTDGDTIQVLVDGEKVKVRIIGIDTPETVSTTQPIECFGPESSAFANKLLEDSNVYLEFDESQGLYDQYGRTLAHVWSDEKKLYAAEAILLGYGIEKTYGAKYKYQDLYVANQNQARDQSLGLWKSC